jgi:hypothetical protein
MKKFFLLLSVVLLLSACSMTLNEILGRQPTPMPLPSATNTPTTLPTFTATVPSPTFTASPTMVGQKTGTATPISTPTALVLTPQQVTALPTDTPVELVPQVDMTGFVTVSVSDEVFYKGKQCQPASAKFTAKVTDAGATSFVVLFVRFKSRQTGTTSEWTSIAMQQMNIPGMYEHELVPLEMKAVDGFENAWVQYQLVATDANSKQVGRTDIFDERLSLLNCVVTPTVSPSVTPTVLTP